MTISPQHFPPVGLNIAADFAASASESGVVQLNSLRPVLLVVPTGFEGDTLEFDVGLSAADLQPLYDSAGTAVSVAVGADRSIALDPSTFAGAAFIKIRSLLSASPQTQSSARTIQIGARLV